MVCANLRLFDVLCKEPALIISPLQPMPWIDSKYPFSVAWRALLSTRSRALEASAFTFPIVAWRFCYFGDTQSARSPVLNLHATFWIQFVNYNIVQDRVSVQLHVSSNGHEPPISENFERRIRGSFCLSSSLLVPIPESRHSLPSLALSSSSSSAS